MTHETRPTSSAHADHDAALIARAAFDDLYEGEADRANALLAECDHCRQVASDLRSLSAAAATDLPALSRPRDFRLSPEQAAGARGSLLRRLVTSLSAPRYGVLRPVAGAALSIGIAFVALGTLQPGGTGAEADRAPAAFGEETEVLLPIAGEGAEIEGAPASDGIGRNEPGSRDPDAGYAEGAAPQTDDSEATNSAAAPRGRDTAEGGPLVEKDPDTVGATDSPADGEGAPADGSAAPGDDGGGGTTGAGAPGAPEDTAEGAEPQTDAEALGSADAPGSGATLIVGGGLLAGLGALGLGLLWLGRRWRRDPLLR